MLTMKRSRSMAVLALTIVLAAAAGWIGGSRIQSPAEVAARTAPPEPAPILVPVVKQVLSTDVVTRGVGRYGSREPVSLAVSDLLRDRKVATSAPVVGSLVEEGDTLMTVSERPVRVLKGQVPMYRDLGPGKSGSDVLQLESSLSNLGFDPGRIDGSYDSLTGAAVAAWYRADGFVPITVTTEDLQQLGLLTDPSIVPGDAGTSGTWVPAGEVLFIESLPVRVEDAGFASGELADGPVATVTNTSVTVEGSVPIESASLVAVGMPVQIDEPDLGISTAGTVSFVAEGPGTNEVDGYHLYFEVEVPDPPRNLVNASVRLTIPTLSTGEPVLTVPVTAVSLAPDGSSRVRKADSASLAYVTVEPGLSAKGYLEVAPIDGTLVEGDQVVLGFVAAAP